VEQVVTLLNLSDQFWTINNNKKNQMKVIKLKE